MLFPHRPQIIPLSSNDPAVSIFRREKILGKAMGSEAPSLTDHSLQKTPREEVTTLYEAP